MKTLARRLDEVLNPVNEGFEWSIEDDYTKPDFLKVMYPILLFLKNLPINMGTIKVGIYMKETVAWNISLISALLTSKQVIIVPEFNSRLGLIHYLNTHNVNVLLVAEDNPFKLEDFENHERIFHTYYNLAVVFDVISSKVLYSRLSIKNSLIPSINLKKFQRIPEVKEWDFVIDLNHKTSLQIPSSATTCSEPKVATLYDEKISFLVDVFCSVFHDGAGTAKVYMNVPKWKYPILSVLTPLIHDIHVIRHFDKREDYDDAIVTPVSIKWLIDNNLYHYYERTFMRWNIPKFILKTLGRMRIKSFLSHTNSIIILNNDLPIHYMRILLRTYGSVYSTYGSIETSQLAAITEYTKDTPWGYISNSLPTIMFRLDSSNNVVSVSGHTLPDELYYPSLPSTKIHITSLKIDDWIRKTDDGFMFVCNKHHMLSISKNGNSIISNRVANIFRASPFIKEAVIVRSDHNFYLAVEISKIMATRMNFSYEKIKDIILRGLRSYNKKVDEEYRLKDVLFNSKITRNLDERPALWVYNAFKLTES